jgi:hypothetical protein
LGFGAKEPSARKSRIEVDGFTDPSKSIMATMIMMLFDG